MARKSFINERDYLADTHEAGFVAAVVKAALVVNSTVYEATATCKAQLQRLVPPVSFHLLTFCLGVGC